MNLAIVMEDTLIMLEGQKQIRLVGQIYTITKAVRIDIAPERNSLNLKYFFENHIEPATNISNYGWSGYSFLNDNDSVLTHDAHIYGGRFRLWRAFNLPHRAIFGTIKIYN